MLQLHISKLKKWGYLTAGKIQSGIVNWSSNGNPTGSIGIMVNTSIDNPVITLKYQYKNEPRLYEIYLTSTPSNLNRGEIWYFVCPQTKKRCRKLYSIGGYFMHREAFSGCMYEVQTQSKKYRQIEKTIGAYLVLENLSSEIYKKYFKQTYAGKPTKRYLRIMEQIQKARSIPYQEIEKAILS